MKKSIMILLAIVMLLVCGAAYALPGEKITITAQTVDYVSAMAGIAKPTRAPHYENERVAVLVRVTVPQWYDTANMSVEMEQDGLVLDSASGLAVATGDYLLFGTLYSTSGALKITLRDNALNAATNAQELWAALYGDRSVSASVSFAPAANAISEVPDTGDKPAPVLVPVFLSLATLAALVVIRRRKAE